MSLGMENISDFSHCTTFHRPDPSPIHHDLSMSDSSMEDILLEETCFELSLSNPPADKWRHIHENDFKKKPLFFKEPRVSETSTSNAYLFISGTEKNVDDNNNECAMNSPNFVPCQNKNPSTIEITDKISMPSMIASRQSTSTQSAAMQGTSTAESHMTLSSDGGAFCRICHEGESREELISPCRCTGTMAMIHQTCVERWLGAANLNRCEVCGFRYITQRTPRPASEWLKNPGTSTDKRNLVGDITCFILLTPLAAISAWLCITGAMHYTMYQNTQWETVGLCTLSIFLIIIYFVWCAVATRYHLRVFRRWRSTNQIVKVVNINATKSGRRLPETTGNSVYHMVSRLFGTRYTTILTKTQSMSANNQDPTASVSSPLLYNVVEEGKGRSHPEFRLQMEEAHANDGFNPRSSLSDTMVLLSQAFKWQYPDLRETMV